MALVIFDPWAPACKSQLFLFTIRDQLRIEKFRAAIGVNAQQGKRKELASLRKRGQHGVSTFREQRETFGPAGGEIGQRQGVQKPPIEVLTTMSAPVPFPQSRGGPAPIGRRCALGSGICRGDLEWSWIGPAGGVCVGCARSALPWTHSWRATGGALLPKAAGVPVLPARPPGWAGTAGAVWHTRSGSPSRPERGPAALLEGIGANG